MRLMVTGALCFIDIRSVEDTESNIAATCSLPCPRSFIDIRSVEDTESCWRRASFSALVGFIDIRSVEDTER